VKVEPTLDISPPHLSPEHVKKLEKHLLSYNWNALQGISFGVDAIKSFILTLAVIDRRLTVNQAVKLSRLGKMFQLTCM
jgi:ATP synthase mitochondrial F1 complex assembly factor 2